MLFLLNFSAFWAFFPCSKKFMIISAPKFCRLLICPDEKNRKSINKFTFTPSFWALSWKVEIKLLLRPRFGWKSLIFYFTRFFLNEYKTLKGVANAKTIFICPKTVAHKTFVPCATVQGFLCNKILAKTKTKTALALSFLNSKRNIL